MTFGIATCHCIYIYIVIVQNVVEKIKNNSRNLHAENDTKFKERAGWPKNLVSCMDFSQKIKNYRESGAATSLIWNWLKQGRIHENFQVRVQLYMFLNLLKRSLNL